MTRIHATGTSELHLTAERATITARISATSTGRNQSIATATKQHNEIVALAQQLRSSGDATWHSADPISTWARKTYAEGAGEKIIIEYVTNSVIRVKLSNLAMISDLVTKLAVAGITAEVGWSLTEGTKREAEKQARKLAVIEAGKIAEDYASALGRQITSVIEITDSPGGIGGGSPRFAQARSFSGGSADVTPAEITVSETVAGTYESVPLGG